MSNYKIEYKIASGTKSVFEAELNKLSLEGYIWCGNLCVTTASEMKDTKSGFNAVSEPVYHIMLTKTTPQS